MGIIAVGGLAIDSIKSPAGEANEILGGSLSHFSNASSFLTKTMLVSIVGNDFKNEFWDFLFDRSIVLGVSIDFKEKTFRWEGYYTEDFGDVVTTKTELNSFEKYEPVIPPLYKKSRKDILFLANIDPVIQKKVAAELHYLPLKVLDTMNYWIENKRKELLEVFSNIDGIIINEMELNLLTGEKNLFSGIDKLSPYNFKFIVLKRGVNGVMVFYENEIISLPAFPVRKVVDPTGAGDSFAGAFLSFIDNSGVKRLSFEKLKMAAAYATVVASFVVEDFGVMGLGRITYKDIKDRFRLYRKMVSF
ncbi:MAG: PfkB family carbohydrate kinase [Brevinematia bacterium]